MYWHRKLPQWVPEGFPLFVTWRLAAGPQWPGRPLVADIVADALVPGELVRHSYGLLAWVVMPDHVHSVMKPIHPLPEIMRWLKTATAHRANALLDRTGATFWRREYYDRWMRSEKELGAAIGYVEENPVRSGLAACAEE